MNWYRLRYSRFCFVCDRPVSRWRPRSHRHPHYAVVLSPGRRITDPDDAESLGLTADARRMREGRE